MVAVLDFVNTIAGLDLDCESHINQKMQKTSVPYTNVFGTVVAHFLSCVEVENTMGEGLTDKILACMERQHPSLHFLRSTKCGLSTK